MTVISCKRSRESPVMTIAKNGDVVVTVQWEVESNDGTDGVRQVLLGAQLIGTGGGNVPVPVRGTPYQWPEEAINGIFLLELEVRRRHDASRYLWSIEGKYSTPDPGSPPGQTPEDPALIPIRYRLDHVTYTEVVDEDKDGKPIVNACEIEYDEPLEEEKARPVLVIEKVFISPDGPLGLVALQAILDLNDKFSGAVNTDNFLAGGAGSNVRKWLCHTIPASDVMTGQNGTFYRTATIRLEYNPKTWDRKVLNRGFKHFETAANKKLIQATVDMTQADGTVIKVPCNEPINLKADGTREVDGALGNFRTHRVKREVDFGGANGLGV